MDYFDFELDVGPADGSAYPVTVRSWPGGREGEAGPTGTLRLPYDVSTLESQLKIIERLVDPSSEPVARRGDSIASDVATVPADQPPSLRAFGEDLFRALMAGEVGTCYQEALDTAGRDRGIRLKLRLDAPELRLVPWEFLFDPNLDDYLCLSNQTPIVRFQPSGSGQKPTLTVPAPLRVLGMVASPTDLSPLDVDKGRRLVETALSDQISSNAVYLHWLDGQTIDDLHAAVAMGRQRWHVFHFVGHGGVDESSQEGVLVLATARGTAARFGASELAPLLAGHSALRLVVLNACQGARGGKLEQFSSTAGTLVRRGVPAVLAMQYDISDEAAIEFGGRFYKGLASGLPVDAATNAARKLLQLKFRGKAEWGTPVLYMSSADGKLFDIDLQANVDDMLKTARLLLWDPKEDSLDRVASLLQQVRDIRPDHPDLGKLQRLLQTKLDERANERNYEIARMALQRQQWAEAQEYLQEIVTRDPHYRDAASLLDRAQQELELAGWYGEAEWQLTEKQSDAVLKIFADIHALRPDYPDPSGLERSAHVALIFDRADNHLNNEQLVEAAADLEEVLRLDPQHMQSKRVLGGVRLALRKREADEYWAVADAALKRMDWEGAVAALRRIRDLDPNYSNAAELLEQAEKELELAAHARAAAQATPASSVPSATTATTCSTTAQNASATGTSPQPSTPTPHPHSAKRDAVASPIADDDWGFKGMGLVLLFGTLGLFQQLWPLIQQFTGQCSRSAYLIGCAPIDQSKVIPLAIVVGVTAIARSSYRDLPPVLRGAARLIFGGLAFLFSFAILWGIGSWVWGAVFK